MIKSPGTRLEEWDEFAKLVYKHISKYANGQYGEKGNDQATGFSIEDCIREIQKYCNRFGKNSRADQQDLDFLKISHYACMAYWKYIDTGKKSKDVFTIADNDDIIDMLSGDEELVQQFIQNLSESINKNSKWELIIKEK